MAKCLVIGGGLAGLSTAIYLSKTGHQVELIEASPKMGGRTYSFYDSKFKCELDNGQHIMMGAYKSSIELLEIIGAQHIPIYQPSLNIEFKSTGRESYHLRSNSKLYPINLLFALLNYSAFNLKEKISVIKFILGIKITNKKSLTNLSVSEWLKNRNQSENIIKSLWEVIGVGALNTKLSVASAELFHTLLKKIFLNGNKSSTVILPNKSLKKLFIDPSLKYLHNNNTKLTTSEKLVEISYSGEKVNEVRTNQRNITEFDNLILCIPPNAIKNIISDRTILPDNVLNMKTTAIISIHITYDDNLFEGQFLGLLGSKIQWIFKNSDHYSIVISAADDMIGLTEAKIMEFVLDDLEKLFSNFDPDKLIYHKVIKEKRATIKASCENESERKKIKSDIKNLFFAGDWTNTGLPGTIEGAILSGKLASIKINDKKKL